MPKKPDEYEVGTVEPAAHFLNVGAASIRKWAHRIKGRKISLRTSEADKKEEGVSASASPIEADSDISVVSPYQREHIVQFYEDDAYLLKSVRAFLAEGDAAIVIATPEHMRILEQHLEIGGVSVEEAVMRGIYKTFDAKKTLAQFMVNGMPDADLFSAVLGTVIEKIGQGSKNIRAFGEMVSLLWQEGNPQGALRLEELWNELQVHHSFALFCAYPMAAFSDQVHTENFATVCHKHSTVTPSETYALQSDPDTRAREIVYLQQKAASLEAAMNKSLHMELKLQEQKDELEEFFENAAMGIHLVGRDGKILKANKAELELLGYSREEYIGKDIRQFHADENIIEDIFTRLSSGEVLKNYKARLRCKDGSIKDVLINSNVLWKDGEFIHTRCFTRNVSELRRQELITQESENRFQALIHATSDVVYRMSPDR